MTFKTDTAQLRTIAERVYQACPGIDARMISNAADELDELRAAAQARQPAEGRTKVLLDLRKAVASKLRGICKLRQQTASEVVDRWILTANARGEHGPQPPPAAGAYGDALGSLLGQIGKQSAGGW